MNHAHAPARPRIVLTLIKLLGSRKMTKLIFAFAAVFVAFVVSSHLARNARAEHQRDEDHAKILSDMKSAWQVEANRSAMEHTGRGEL